MSKYIIRNYKENDRQQIYQLMVEVWGSDRGEEYIRNWDWEFFKNPFNPPGNSPIVVLEYDGKVVGIAAIISGLLMVNEEMIPSGWIAHLMTHQQHRGRGLKILRELTYRNFFYLGFPLDEHLPMYLRMGDNVQLTETVSMTSIYDFKSLITERYSYPGSRLFAWIGGLLWQGLIKAFMMFNRKRTKRQIQIKLEQRFGDDVDVFWEEVSQNHSNMNVRNAVYLNWRFVECPTREYKILIAREDEKVVGYLVFRDNMVKGVRRGYLTDMMVRSTDSETLDCLTEKAISLLRAKGAALISCQISPTPFIYSKVLRRNGFFFRRTGRPLVCNSYFSRTSGKAGIELAYPWFITAGDSDLDLA